MFLSDPFSYGRSLLSDKGQLQQNSEKVNDYHQKNSPDPLKDIELDSNDGLRNLEHPSTKMYSKVPTCKMIQEIC